MAGVGRSHGLCNWRFGPGPLQRTALPPDTAVKLTNTCSWRCRDGRESYTSSKRRKICKRPVPHAELTSTQIRAATLDNDLRGIVSEEDQPGSSELATLRMLEWSRLCSFVAKFTSTSLGRQELLNKLQPARKKAEVEEMQAATLAAELLEGRYAAAIDFGGISTSQAAAAIRRAKKGGLLTGQQLLAVAGLTAGGGRLRRLVNAAAKQAGEIRSGSPLQPILSAVKGIEPHKELEDSINGALGEGGVVRDSASDEVSRTRARVRTIESRLRSVLKGMNGEPTEQGTRLCLAVQGGDTAPKGVLLGSSTGGSILYIEPPAAVPLNNELAAARGEACAAEESVLWRVTGEVMGAVDSLQHVLNTVVWLDTVFAKARFGRWIEGTYPEFGSFPRNQAPQKKGGSRTKAAAAEADGKEWIHLHRLRHPLLLGDYLENRSRVEEVPKRQKTKGLSMRRFSNRKENMSGDGGTSSDEEQEEAHSKLKSPVPIDIRVRPEVKAVIITGPNTGGKTASLKALGLAVAMARCGLAVPAAHPAVLPPFSAVLADIGDEQSLSSSLSTFSGHLKRIQGVRQESDGKSLVLLDEVGTGTDPGQGAALGLALLRALVRGGARGAGFVLATTHQSALTSLKYDDPRFENASVEFDEQKLEPTFRLLWGIPGRSNALNTAARIGLEPAIVEAARERLGTALNNVEFTITKLEDMRSDLERDEDRTAAAQKRTSQLDRELAASRRQLSDEEGTLELQKSNAALAVVERAQARLQQLRSEKLAQEKQQKAQQDAATKREEEQKKLQKQEEFERKTPFSPQLGQMVTVPKLKGRGKVVAINSEEVVVQMGMLRVATKAKDLRR